MKNQLIDAVLSAVHNKEVNVIWTKFNSFKSDIQFSCLLLEESSAKFPNISVKEHRSPVFGSELKVVITSTNAVLVMVKFHGETSKNF